MLKMDNITPKQRACKILIMGLDNSGKTSILLSLSYDANLLSYYSLNPTKGINIEKFETHDLIISCWDFGGQEKFREKYLRNFDEYTEQVEKIIFVIDVQDIKRYDLALDYLNKIIKKLKNLNEKIDLSIFLHKYDPNLTRQEKFKSIDEKVKVELVSKIKQIIPSEFNYDVYRTSIYTVFEKNLV